MGSGVKMTREAEKLGMGIENGGYGVSEGRR